MIPGVGAVADARDAIQAFINGDELGAALNAAGAFSGVGDGVKTAAAVGLFIGKYPDKAVDVAKALGKYAFPHAPELVKLEVLDIIFNGVASVLSDIHKVPTNVLVELADKGADLRKIKTLLENVYKRENGWPLLDEHFAKHAPKLGLDPANLADKDTYFDMAVELINRPVGVEKYYDIHHGTLGVYERSTEKYVAGNTKGQIATFFYRDADEIDYEPTRFIKLN